MHNIICKDTLSEKYHLPCIIPKSFTIVKLDKNTMTLTPVYDKFLNNLGRKLVYKWYTVS